MKAVYNYLSNMVGAFRSLFNGMRLTLYYFYHPSKILTQQYPENRKTLYIPEKFRGQVVLTHDEKNEHNCNGCGMCERACPNGTIKIITANEEGLDGKKKRIIDKWVYNIGMCTFCGLCIEACPSDAITMNNSFENSLYDRQDLIRILNKPGSKIKEKAEK